MTSSISPNSLPDIAQSWHTLEIENTVTLLESNTETGLTSTQAQARIHYYGKNELKESSTRTNWQILLDQFTNIMLIMLIIVAIISGLLDLQSWQTGNLQPGEIPFKDTLAILLIVIINGVLGFLQESKAEKALAALKKLSSPKVRLLRDGKQIEVESQHLVPGDIMLLEAGMQVASDARLITDFNLQVRESALTGEAQAIHKQSALVLTENTVLGDRINLVFQGTEIVQGRATVIVTKTGMQTELGRIASMLQSVENEPTPLQQRMSELANVLVTGSLILVAIVVGGGLIDSGISNGWNFKNLGNVLKELVEVSLSMAVAVVPEGLPAVITVTLALGTQRMVKRKALIRRLPAVETLGSVTTICSDKTGTLTQNKMVVQQVKTASHSFIVKGEGYIPTGDFHLINDQELDTNLQSQVINPEHYQELQTLLFACVLCNDSLLQYAKDQWTILGDPTEGALIVLAGKGGVDKEPTIVQMPRLAELPFSSERKRMSVICEAGDWEIEPKNNFPYLMFTKGSSELILERCTQIQLGEALEQITETQKSAILAQNNQMAAQGLRVLGFAYKPLTTIPETDSDESAEKQLVWLGLVGMLDAPRPEVRAAVAECLQAGIRPIMITGDHQLTAQAIAYNLGIAKQGDRVLTGQQLQQLSEAELEQEVTQVSIYARVAPEHKLRIVKALQNRHQVVAMTGDGVNDAPALKQADIGIAMGITGTDVSKEASDMVLLDDNFATIVAATEEGRVVYTNIRRFIKYILGSNIGEVLTIAAAPIIGLGGVPLTPLQILWMNLVTDGLPALALAVEPAEPDIMQRPPFNPRDSIFARGLGAYMIRIGIIFAMVTITLMIWAYNHTNTPGYTGDKEAWKTMVFTTLCIAQMGHAIAVRSNTRLTLELNPFSNPYLLVAVTVTTGLQLLLIYVEPLRNFFGTHWLSMQELLICLGFSSLMFIWVEMEKLLIRWYQNR